MPIIDRELEARLTEAITAGYVACQAGQATEAAEWLANGSTEAYVTMGVLRRLRINGEVKAAEELERALFEETCREKETKNARRNR